LPMQPLLQHQPVGWLIGVARRRIKQVVGRRLREHRLSPQQFWVLVNLGECPDISLGELAERLHMDDPTASRIVGALTLRRLARIHTHPTDRRRRRLGLTPAGVALAKRVAPIAVEVRRAVEQGFTPRERDNLRRLLRRVVDNVERLDREPEAAAR
jgi:MarR family transcriptional regulator, transcriptional regulator for hemolysin